MIIGLQLEKASRHESLVSAAMTGTGKVTRIGDGKFGARWVRFTNHVRGVLKPKVHSTDLYRGVPQDTMHLREVAAYQLDRQVLHFDVVPPTLLTVYEAVPASLQLEVQGVRAAGITKDVFAPEGPKYRLAKFSSRISVSDLRKVVLFDLIVNSVDRHAKNCLFDNQSKTKRVWAIDNGLTFGPYFEKYSSIFHRKLFRHGLRLSESEKGLLRGVTLDRLERVLSRYLSARDIAMTYLRIEWLLEQGDLGFAVLAGEDAGRDDFPPQQRWFANRLRTEPFNRVLASIENMGTTTTFLTKARHVP